MGGVYRIQTFLDLYIFFYLQGPLVPLLLAQSVIT